MQKTITSLLVVGLVVAGGWYLYSNQTDSSSETIAIVNGETLTRDELEPMESQIASQQGLDVAGLDAESRAALQTQALDTLISRALIQQAVANSDIAISEADIEARKGVLSSQFENKEAFASALASVGLTDQALEEEIETDLKVEAYLFQTLALDTLTATEAEILATYEAGVAGVENAPALADVRAQVEQAVIEEKQQALIAEHIQSLRAAAEIEILI